MTKDSDIYIRTFEEAVHGLTDTMNYLFADARGLHFWFLEF